MLANLAYLVTLPLETMQQVPSDRVASATADVVFPGAGAAIMAVVILVSTFGCNNGLILAGARALYAMSRDRLFFRKAGDLNAQHAPAWGLVIQGIWAAVLVLPRTVKTGADGAVSYGNLYGDLLTYVISARSSSTRSPSQACSACAAPARTPSGPTARSAIRSCRPSTSRARSSSWWCCLSTRGRAPGPGWRWWRPGLPVYFLWKRRPAA
jgi:hypothetical protein